MSERDRSRSTGPALEKWYQFLRWLMPTVEKFPKAQKFTLGDRIQISALDVLERLIEATYSRQATPLLAAANLALEKLRFLFRLASDLQLLELSYPRQSRGFIFVSPSKGQKREAPEGAQSHAQLELVVMSSLAGCLT